MNFRAAALCAALGLVGVILVLANARPGVSIGFRLWFVGVEVVLVALAAQAYRVSKRNSS